MDALGPFCRRGVELPSLVGRGIVPLLHTVTSGVVDTPSRKCFDREP
jgi:hypothetical protein